jgi:23S rRNA (uracil1939-C5)-methyltransferase
MSEHAIKRLGHQGDGIADGPVFASLTLPGEIVSGNLDGSRLNDVRIVKPSAQRVAAPCRHFKQCGGCLLQHASDDFVAKWKIDVVQQALRAQGLDAEFRPIQTSPPKTRRRATFSARRTKKGAMVGFHQRASGNLVEISECHVVHPSLLAAIPLIESLTEIGGSRKAELSVTVTSSAAGLDLFVMGGKPMNTQLFQLLAQLTENHKVARLFWEGEAVAISQPPTQRFGRADVVPPPGAFLQATTHGESALLSAVNEICSEANFVADLFSGCGTFTLPLAENVEVHAVEGEVDMLSAMDKGWRNANDLKKVSHEARDLFRRPLLADELRSFDVIVIDPPRAGAEAQVKEISKSRVSTIAYVSCNPVSFARDSAVLVAAGYNLNWIQVVDQFRWSPHVELVAEFTRNLT